MTRVQPINNTITVHVPFRIVKRGGRKEMQLPEEAAQPRRTDNTLVKALARAFRWKRKLETGEYATITELAEREGIASSYMTRVLRLTLLAPETVEAILDGRQGPEVTLANLMEPFPLDWKAQTCQAIGLKQMGQAAACPNGMVLTLSRERPRRFSARNFRVSRNMLAWQAFRKAYVSFRFRPRNQLPWLGRLSLDR